MKYISCLKADLVKMLEEEFTGDERHEVVPVNWLRHGLLNKRIRASWYNIFYYSSWKIRNFNLNRSAQLEFWRDDIGVGTMKGCGMSCKLRADHVMSFPARHL